MTRNPLPVWPYRAVLSLPTPSLRNDLSKSRTLKFFPFAHWSLDKWPSVSWSQNYDSLPLQQNRSRDKAKWRIISVPIPRDKSFNLCKTTRFEDLHLYYRETRVNPSNPPTNFCRVPACLYVTSLRIGCKEKWRKVFSTLTSFPGNLEVYRVGTGPKIVIGYQMTKSTHRYTGTQ